jgi:tetratricopeptide (TPR) repeat protein
LWLALTLPFVVATQTLIRPPNVEAPPLWLRPIVALDAIAFYLWKIVAPLGFAPDYSRTPQWLIRRGPVMVTWVVPILFGAIVWWLSRRRGLRAAALAIVFVAPLLPVLGLVPFHYQEYSTVADRYVYLPMLAVAAAVAWLVAVRRAVVYAVVALVIVAAILSNRQTGVWRDTDALFAHTLAINPNSIAAHNAMGQAVLDQSPPDLETAGEHFLAALEAHPYSAGARANYANVLLLQGRIGEALPHYRTANAARPNDPRIVNNYAVALIRSGRANEAFQLLLACVTNALPAIAGEMRHYANLHVNLATLHAAGGKLTEAESHYHQALRLQPQFAPALKGLDELRRRQNAPTTSPATQSATAPHSATAPAAR